MQKNVNVLHYEINIAYTYTTAFISSLKQTKKVNVLHYEINIAYT